MSGHVDAEQILHDLLAPDHDRLADRVLEASFAAIARTPQRRAMRAPWSLPTMWNMPSTARSVLLGAALLVAVGGGTYLVAGGGPSATPAATVEPTRIQPPPGISGWTSYASAVYGLEMAFPEGWSSIPATRAWQAGDRFPVDGLPYADKFFLPVHESSQIGLFVWEVQPAAGADLGTYGGLEAVAEQFCRDAGLSSCADFTARAQYLCVDPCRPGLFVPTAGIQYAFFEDDTSRLIGPPMVRVVIVAREDSFPASVPFGGSERLLLSILRTMGVWAPGAS
jgi:hypothetical protein